MFPSNAMRTGVVLALTSTLAVSAAANADGTAEVMAFYDGSLGGLPDDSACWVLVNSGSEPAPYHEDGAAVMGPTSTPGWLWWESDLPLFSFENGASMTVRLNVTYSTWWTQHPWKRSGFYIGMRDADGRNAYLGISSDRVVLLTIDPDWNAPEYMIDTIGVYRDYTLQFEGDIVNVLIDGKTVITSNVAFGAAGQPSALVGDLSIHTGSQTHTASISVVGVPECEPADLNCDGVVDVSDLLMLLANWGVCSEPYGCRADCPGDINGDGVVDVSDLLQLLSNWG